MPTGKLLSRVLLTVAAVSAVAALAAVALRGGRPHPAEAEDPGPPPVRGATAGAPSDTVASAPAEGRPAVAARPVPPPAVGALRDAQGELLRRVAPTAPGDIAHVNLLLDPRADDTARNEAAVALRRAKYAGLADDLLRVLDNPDEKERFRSFAMQHLGAMAREAGVGASTARDLRDGGFGEGGGGSRPMVAPTTDRGQETAPTRILDVLRRGLDDRHAAVRREALLAQVRLGDPEGIAAARRWLTDPSPEADAGRDLAIRCAQEMDLREYIPLIRQYASAGGAAEDRGQKAPPTRVGAASTPRLSDSRGPFDSAQGKLDPPLGAEASADAKAAPTPEVVRIAAIVALSQWGDQESRPAFEVAAQSDVVRLQRAGKAALARLDGLSRH